MDTHPAGAVQIGQLLAHLEGKLAELDQLQHDLAEDTHALTQAVHSVAETASGPPSVYSVRGAATELGVSTSMLHKLLKDRRLGHLKVGARTLITPEHLARFRAASEAGEPSSGGLLAESMLGVEQAGVG